MRYTYGQKDTSANANRLSNSVPASYTIVKDGTDYYGECNNPTGNDITANTSPATVINAALLAAEGEGGGLVFLKSGLFLDDYGTTPIQIKNNTHLLGSGKNTILRTNNATTDAIIRVASKYYWSVENMQLDTSTTQTAGHYIYAQNVSGSGIHQNLLRNLWLDSPYEGILFDSDVRWTNIENVAIKDPQTKGIVMNESSFIFGDSVHVYSDTPPATYTHSLHMMHAFSCYFTRCEFVQARTYGVISDPAGGVTNQFLRFDNCVVETYESAGAGDGWVFTDTNGGKNEGIYLTECWGCWARHGAIFENVESAHVNGGAFHGNGRHGIWIKGTSTKDVQIHDATIAINSRETTNTYDGVHVDAAVCHFKVMGNNFYGANFLGFGAAPAMKNSVLVAAGASDYYIILGNVSFDMGTGGVSDGGTGVNKVVADNV
jgi:hypothetical protein